MKHPMRRVAVFVDKYPLLGPLVWILCLQYLAVQLITAAQWPGGYSWRINLISDLGNTMCGAYGGRYVCSPGHNLMNASFISLGLTMAFGSLLIYHEFKKSRLSLTGFSLMGLAGLGTALVGLFPENVDSRLHATGAFLGLLVGNLSLIVLALALRGVNYRLRLYTFLSGLLSSLTFLLFIAHANLGLGPGGLERLVSYPQTVWLVLFGLYMTRNHLRRAHR